ncbi:MAG TPA: aminotransferase class IV [Candidatus Saccharimonadales bacterium]|nr:aminotransferase class IV [Candidatus Saccharimonadales bacterium]
MFELQKSTVYFKDRFVPFKDANFSIASPPVLYGLSIYTVVPVNWNKKTGKLYIFRLEDHFQRLQNSARIVDFHSFLEKWTYTKFAAVISELVTRNNLEQDALIRVTVSAGGVMTGTRMHGLKHELTAFVYPFVPTLPAKGAKVCVSSWQRTPDNSIPSRAKINGSYINSSLMKNEALLDGFDDAISLDEHGHVAEATVANLFLIRNGELLTPHSSTDLLEGITRSTVCELAEKLDIKCQQRSIDRSELYLADEAFLSGSSVRIAPITSIDNRLVGAGTIGPITHQLMRVYDQATHGTTTDFSHWRQTL